MDTIISISGKNQDCVTGVLRPSSVGKLTVTSLLAAMGIEEKEFNKHWLQCTLIRIKPEDA